MAEKMFTRPKSLRDLAFHYCPGCHHGLVHRLVAEVIDEMKAQDRVIGIAPVGCAVMAYQYFNFDMVEAAHGRAPAVATGVKRVWPGSVVFTYQGDGDLAAIGTAEIVHAAARAEKITTIFVNNAIYGMTGGQMAPTTLIGQTTTTTPLGRKAEFAGYPIRVTEMLAGLEGVAYAARVAVNNPANMNKAKAAIKRAFEVQTNNKGFSLVEVMAVCPTNWRMKALEAAEWLQEQLLPFFPLGVIKDSEESGNDA